MADFNSSLPIRTQNNGDVVAFLADSTTPSIENTIKAASTAAVATDTALVVALSPNSPLPAGSAVIGAVTQSGGPWTQNLTEVGGSAIALGQTTMSASLPVTIASNQTPLPVSQSGSWTVSATQGTSPWVTLDESDGSATGGTAASYSSLAGGIYNSTPPTLTNGQQASLQLNSAGALIVAASITFPYDTNYGTVDSTTLRTAAQIGNATGAANFGAGATTAQTLRVASNLYDGSGNALASTSGSLDVSLTTALPAGSNNIGSVNQGTSPWVVSGTVAVTQSTSPWVVEDLADGSVTGGTAGTKSQLGGGIYNSTPPTLTNGQQASLQLDASGNLDVNLQTPLPAGTNLIGAVNLDIGSSPVSSTNPVPVSIVSTTPGTAIQNYQTSVNLAAGATHTFTYTVATGHTFNLYRVWSSASGKIKSLVQNNGTTIFVGFNSTANPNIDMTVQVPPLIAAGNTVTVAITNNDLTAFDVYVTIEGNQN